MTTNRDHKFGAICQFPECEVEKVSMLTTHHLFPDDKETILILCANHHSLIDHEKEGFIKGKATRKKKTKVMVRYRFRSEAERKKLRVNFDPLEREIYRFNNF